MKWGVLTACLCLVAAGVFAVVHPWKTDGTPVSDPDGMMEQEPEPSEYPPAGNVVKEVVQEGQESGSTVNVVYNDVDGSLVGVGSMFDLAADAFCPMSAEETLDYFGIMFPEDGLLPGLELTGGGCFGDGHGVYRTESRGVFYDRNSYLFANQDKKVILTLSRTFHRMPSEAIVAKGPDPIEFTEIHGWKLAFYRFTDWFIDEEGRKCVYTEFLLDDVICTVSAVGLEDDELAQALMNLLPQKECVQDPVVVTGIVEHVDNRTFHYTYNFGKEHVYDEQHDYIEVDCGGTPLTVWLLGEADRFNKGDCVTVTYNGEPATVHNIWPGQLVSVELQ